jgi:ATP-binding cassette subfamily B protein
MKYIPQLDESDCGAACLAMIADHYRLRRGITEIREIAGTDRQGTNLAGLIKAATALGFDAKAMKGDAESLDDTVPTPFIAHTRETKDAIELLHFVVVVKIGNNGIRVLDPGDGKLHYTREEFLARWTGYCVFMSPSEEFKPDSSHRKNLWRFLPLLRPHGKSLVLAGLASLLLIAFGILGSFYYRYLIDEVIFSKAEFTLAALSIGMLLLVLFKALLGAIRSMILNHFSIKADLRLIYSYLSHVLRLPLSFFDSRKTGEILSRFGDAQNVRSALSQASISIVMDTLMLIVVGPFLYVMNSTLFLIVLATVPLSSIVVWVFSIYYRKQYREQKAQNADVQSYLVEMVHGISTVKALNAQERVFWEYEKKQMKAINTGWSTAKLSVLGGFLNDCIDDFGGTLFFWVGSYFILKGQISLGTLISFNALSGYFTGPLQRLINLQPSLQEAFVSADRIGEILELEPELSGEERLIQPAAIRGGISARGLSFQYGTRRPLFEDLSFDIAPGEWVAFVGPSGSGKTTLIKLLLKFYRPTSGNILIDGNNLEDIDTTNLRSRIGYVSQDVFLFSGTIWENIALHHPDASMEEIVEAAKRAQAHEFISELPQRYNTQLSEGGSSLSGGERQRLALSRAFLGKPELFLFDEATSNLDSISERKIHEVLQGIRGEKVTTIMNAHRLSTVVGCDRIFVIDKGKIIQTGNHVELLGQEGLYRSMWQGALI